MSQKSQEKNDKFDEKAEDVSSEERVGDKGYKYDENDYKAFLADPHFTWTPEEEKRLLRKVDWNMVPFYSLLYLMSFLDRVNIGQARLNGLEADLGLKGDQYLTCLTIFFVGYVIFETPSNIALKYLKPSRWITFIMVIWSIVMTLMGTVENFAGLAAARFFLGVAECGLFPGICYALVCWYKRREANLRISLFFSAATVAGAFGGLLAYGIGHLDGVGGKGGWAWIFIIEGLATFVIALFSPWLVHDFPEDAKFLTPRERAIVIRRLEVDHGPAGDAPFNVAHILSAIKEWKVWVFMLNYIGVATPLYALALFTPTIISSLGSWSLAESQLLTTPPYFLGFFTTVATALLSDRIQKRGIFMLFWMSWTIIGYILIITIDVTKHPAQAYVGIFFAVSGVSPCIATCITWCGTNLGPTYKRATGMGMMFTLGNSGGIVASESYRASDRPRFIRGHALSLGFSALSLITTTILLIAMSRENKRRDAMLVKPDSTTVTDSEERDGVLDGRAQVEASPEQMKRWGLEGKTREELFDLGDRHPSFRYML